MGKCYIDVTQTKVGPHRRSMGWGWYDTTMQCVRVVPIGTRYTYGSRVVHPIPTTAAYFTDSYCEIVDN